MANEIAVPEHLRKYITSTSASSDADAMASASLSFPRISLRGRKFRVIEGGEEIQKPSDELHVVILAVEPGAGLMQKTFYRNGYVSGDKSPPDCSSANGLTPDPWITSPEHSKCQTCPKNMFGSATSNNGKKSKACKDSKRLWVAMPDAIDGTVYSLGVPVTSLKAMSEYGNMLKSNGVPAAAVLTRLSMKDTEFPELMFDFVGVLEADTLELSMKRNEAKDFIVGGQHMALEHHQERGPSRTLAAPGEDASQLLKNEESGVKNIMSADEAAGNW